MTVSASTYVLKAKLQYERKIKLGRIQIFKNLKYLFQFIFITNIFRLPTDLADCVMIMLTINRSKKVAEKVTIILKYVTMS